MILDGYDVLIDFEIAGESKVNDKNKPLKKAADEESNVTLFIQVRSKY